MLRVLSELLWSLRRDGLAISTSQAIDAGRVVALVGWSDRGRLATALEGVLVTRRDDRPLFRKSFDEFWRPDRGHPGDLFDRLRGRGFSDAEVDALRQLVQGVGQRSGDAPESEGLSALVATPLELDALLRAARVRRLTRGLVSPRAAGAFAERVFDALGVSHAAVALDRIGRVLEEALGNERGALLAAALRDELAAMKRRVRGDLERRVAEPERVEERGVRDLPFGAMGEEEERQVRRAVRSLAEKLRGSSRVRARRHRRGRLDAARTSRAAAKTFGVPLRLFFRRPRDERPSLVLACDVSESVRGASRFMLELVAVASSLFQRSRSFVFIGDVVETTDLFASGVDQALRRVASGALLNLGATSNYGRALAELERALAGTLDKRTTVVVLGDGRSAQVEDGAAALRRLRERARAVVWLCPEPPSRWGVGDSRMLRYRDASTVVLPARTARELEEAARRLVRLR